jgi:KDEL-tailed cysteine endopeptidase
MAKKLALVLLAQLEPAAGGVKFGEEDLKSDESLWNLYERWGVRYNVEIQLFNLYTNTSSN